MQKLKSSKSIFFDNTETEHIIVQPIKLDNMLRDFEKRLGDLSLTIGSLAIFITVLLTLITADFKEKFSLPAATWQAVFVVTGIFSLFSTIYFIYKFKKTSKSDRRALVESLINKKDKMS